jgi:MprA protease rhombosortase-interaction domain-containing protein
LLKRGDAAGSRQSVADEVVRLGEAYSIVTEYTSFLVLENDAEFKRWSIDRRNVLRTERDRAAQQRVSQAMEQMRQRAAADLGPAAVETMLTVAPAATPNGQAPGATPQSRDLSFNQGPAPVRFGGGAIDPITGLAVIAVGGAAWRLRRRGEKDRV